MRFRSLHAAAFVASYGLLAVSGADLTAQQTIVVDANAGPGHQFTALEPALAAASSGDTVIVRAGNYSEPFLRVTTGLSIIGQGAVRVTLTGAGSPTDSAFTIEALPASEAFALRGVAFGFGGFLSPRTIRAHNCAGLVHIEEIAGIPDSQGLAGPLFLEFENCDRSVVHGTFVRNGSVGFRNSRGTVSSCVLEGGLTSTQSQLTVDGSNIRPGEPFFLTQPAVRADGGTLSLSRSLLAASGVTGHAPALSATAATTVRLDPTASLTPTGSASPVEGGAAPIVAELSTLSASADPGLLHLDLQARTGQLFATLASVPTPITSTPWGDLWVDPSNNLFLCGGVLAGRTQVCDLAIPSGLTGLQFAVQTITFDQDFGLSNGSSIVLR